MKQVKWFERNFEFNSTQNIFPSLVERLEGTPLRLEHKIRLTPVNILECSIDNSWTIKENIGHLTDLEPLWQIRLQEIIAGEPVMTAADLQNNKTREANHNTTSIETLLQVFRRARETTLKMLEQIDEKTVFSSAIHPRLNKPMRTMDLFLFVAEHDDHHLARITTISRILTQ